MCVPQIHILLLASTFHLSMNTTVIVLHLKLYMCSYNVYKKQEPGPMEPILDYH